MESPLPVAVRAYTERQQDPEEESSAGSVQRGKWTLPTRVLAFDTETTIDHAQQLNFGSWRYFHVTWSEAGPVLACVEEGLFYADDLPSRDPAGFQTLRDYAESRPPSVDRSTVDAVWRMPLLSAREFTDDVLLRLGFRGRAWIVGFNLPFDLSRVAYDESESRDYLAGGFSLTLGQYLAKDGSWLENRWRSRVAIKTIDSKRGLMGFKRPKELDPADEVPEGESKPNPQQPQRGNFLDLRTLAFALTNESYSLERAIQAFVDPEYKEAKVKHGVIDPRYIDYNRQDVGATAALFERLIAEHRRHPIRLSPTNAYSPASVGKAYLRAMGVRPRLETQPEFPGEVLGQAMVAYYGGRAECRIRRTPVPVTYVDFLSMYPTVNSLMGLWDLVIADTVKIDDRDTLVGEVQGMLDDLTLEDCFDPRRWPGLVGIAEIEPDGDMLPVRARYGDNDSWGIGLNPTDLGVAALVCAARPGCRQDSGRSGTEGEAGDPVHRPRPHERSQAR